MAGRFVRASKYRHVFGKPTRKESTYDNLHISRNAWDTNLIKANPEFLSVNWEASGGGAFAVIPVNEKGRLPEQIPLFRGHTAPVLDTDWNPFNDHVIASGSDDGKVFIWQVPQGFTLYSDAEEPEDVAPVSKLAGHSRKVGQVLFNTAAENILASASGDYTIKIWDISTGKSSLTLKHGDIVQSLSWNANGTMLVTTSRDKKLRIWDVRQERAAHEVPGHTGAKNSRAVWMGEHDRVATTGFSKMSDRQMALWDTGNPTVPIGGFTTLDSISGVCMPFWDDGTQCLYLAGKGDGNIRYFEYENDKFEFLSEYKSGDPQRGIAFVPRRGINVHENEVMRAYKTVNDAYVEPISFVVPRRAEVFQADIYPPATGLKPGVSTADWLGGKSALPAKIDLESIYEGNAPVEVPADYKPPKGNTAPSPAKATSSISKKEPEPTTSPATVTPTSRSPPPTMTDQKVSIAAMASKFQDNEEDLMDDADETSSFEEIPKPVARPIPASKTEAAAAKPASPTTPRTVAATTTAATVSPVSQATPRSTQGASAAKPTTMPTSSGPMTPLGAASSGGSWTGSWSQSGSGNVEASLQQITRMLEQQTRTIAAQSEKIGALTSEVDSLKMRVGSGGGGGSSGSGAVGGAAGAEQSERIRQLELELEAARS